MLLLAIYEQNKTPKTVQYLTEYYHELSNTCLTSTDCGIDVTIPTDIVVPAKVLGYKIHLGIYCQPTNMQGYYLYARSSLGSKTPLRVSNSVGIIDPEYRGEIIACVDNLSDEPYEVKRGTRLFQLCAPDLKPLKITLRSKLTTTKRGEGGFGSTGI